MAESFCGWLLDIYEDEQSGITLWFLDTSGNRRRLHQKFPVTFQAAGPEHRLRALRQYMESNWGGVHLSLAEERDLFDECPIQVTSIHASTPRQQAQIFRQTSRRFPDINFYNADIPLSLRHSAAYGTFPLAQCEVAADERGKVLDINILDTPWDIDPALPDLNILHLSTNTDPHRVVPSYMIAQSGAATHRIPLEPVRPLLVSLSALLGHHDPDVLVTQWGDTWLLDWLLVQCSKLHFSLPLNRDPDSKIIRRKARSYFSYGQIIYRGQQVLLSGRWHIDTQNATLWNDYGLEGTLEFARVTRLPVQNAARTSPGTGISSMQILTALRGGIMIPWHKQQVEQPKTALNLLRSDQGGLVYQPITGLHQNVGEVDFVSMYPSLMVRYNISPETIKVRPTAPSTEIPGLIPQTLAPLLDKRITLKKRLSQLTPRHSNRQREKARSSTHKWLLVTCFGYLGYKNARFGRIEAHEAVTAGGREALLRAKEVAENLGFTILHLYVDALWVAQNNHDASQDFEVLLNQIGAYTGLSIGLDGIYRWVVFLPSRNNERIPVANRYFGVFQDGSIKVRGIEARRRDTAPFVAATQMELLEHLAHAQTAAELPKQLPEVNFILRKRLFELRSGTIPLEKLLVGLKLSRELDAYTQLSPAARAARQLQQIGKDVRPGQRVRLLYLRGEPSVHAWDLPNPPNPRTIDIEKYTTLLLRAASTILQPLGIHEEHLPAWLDRVPVSAPMLLPVSTACLHVQNNCAILP